MYFFFFALVPHHDKQLGAASYNFASAATRGLLPRSKEVSTQKKLDAVWGVVQQIVEVRYLRCSLFSKDLVLLFSVWCIISNPFFFVFGPNRLLRKDAAPCQLCHWDPKTCAWKTAPLPSCTGPFGLTARTW